MPRLPIVNSDNNVWGSILNTWLTADHDTTAYHRPRVIDRENSFDVAVLPGDVVYWDTASATYKQALANGTVNQKLPVGIRSQFDPTMVTLFGWGDTTAVLAPGSIYYLSDSIAGRLTDVMPTTQVVRIGHAVNSNNLFVRIEDLVKPLDSTTSYVPPRTFNTTYQPDTTNVNVVTISTTHVATAPGGLAYIQVLTDTTSPPAYVKATTGITGASLTDSTNYFTTTFILGRSNYYRVNVTQSGGTVTIVNWNESPLKN